MSDTNPDKISAANIGQFWQRCKDDRWYLLQSSGIRIRPADTEEKNLIDLLLKCENNELRGLLP